MARIPAVDPEQTRGVRKLSFWVNKRQYGGAVPPFTTSWRAISIILRVGVAKAT
jgi:hypothetical protein